MAATSQYAYSYDSVGRLYEVRKDGVVISNYTYDGNGNRLSFTDGVTTLTGIYDSQDRLLQYGNVAYTYSANGELLSKTSLGQTTSYQYDVLGNLLSVTLPDNTGIQYIVDGMDRRVGKKVNGTLVKGFLYKDALNPVAELDGANNIVSRFVYASRVNVPDYLIQGGIAYRIIADYLGSPRIVVNTQTGVIVQRMDFDEFGRIILDTNPGFQPFGFAGGLYDQDTGLTRFGARDFDAELGRWLLKDPILFRGGDENLYRYVLGDPVNKTDPTGLWFMGIIHFGPHNGLSETDLGAIESSVYLLEANLSYRENQQAKIRWELKNKIEQIQFDIKNGNTTNIFDEYIQELFLPPKEIAGTTLFKLGIQKWWFRKQFLEASPRRKPGSRKF